MSSEWGKKSIGELITHTKGIAFKSKDYLASGVPLIRVTNFTDDSISSADLKFVSLDIAATNSSVRLKFKDIIVATVGSWPNNPASVVGRTISVPKWAENSLMNQNSVILRSQSMVDQRFIYYHLKSADFANHIISKAQGSANQASITLDAIFSYQLNWPNEKLRMFIVEILTTIDDRIALLRETNSTLEAIAQALFKSWFVDFDPVRAKQDGREPEGMDADTAALFPDSFEESELGLVPKGWSYRSFQDAVSIFDSKRIPLSGQVRANRQGQYPYYGAAAQMDSIDDFLFDGVYFLMGEDGSVIDPDGYPITQYVYGKFWVNNHAHILQGKNGICTEHVMLFAKRTSVQPYITGAVQAKLSQSNMWRIPFLMPPKAISEGFGELMEPLFKLFRHNSDKAQTLASIRDTLLPRLISGQLRLPEVKVIVTNANV